MPPLDGLLGSMTVCEREYLGLLLVGAATFVKSFFISVNGIDFFVRGGLAGAAACAACDLPSR